MCFGPVPSGALCLKWCKQEPGEMLRSRVAGEGGQNEVPGEAVSRPSGRRPPQMPAQNSSLKWHDISHTKKTKTNKKHRKVVSIGLSLRCLKAIFQGHHSQYPCTHTCTLTHTHTHTHKSMLFLSFSFFFFLSLVLE